MMPEKLINLHGPASLMHQKHLHPTACKKLSIQSLFHSLHRFIRPDSPINSPDFTYEAFYPIIKTITNYPAFRLLLFAFLLFSSGCGSQSQQTGEMPPNMQIHVAAATDLQPWLGDALAQWGQGQNPPIEVLTSYDASGKIAAQIRAGAPIDLFLSADIEIARKLAADGFINSETVKPYARGRLALLFRRTINLDDWKKIVVADFRHLVIANPATAPYGKAAKSALENAGFWPRLESKIVVADSIRQALEQVISGNAEAGLVALGQARAAAASDESLSVLEIPQADHAPIVQGLGLVNHADQSAKSRELAMKLADYITSAEASVLFQEHGLTPEN
jgi:molybdate transport system substrate-binding protein